MSRKSKGSDAILYIPTIGALASGPGKVLDAGDSFVNGWYKIKDFGASTALPDLKEGSVFKAPAGIADAITLAEGDEVFPLTLTEFCKVDVEVSAEMGTIDATDSCDYPYMVNLPDGFVNLSGSINTMLRFDNSTGEIVPVTEELLVKFFDIITDDGEGGYELRPFNDDDILLMIHLDTRRSGTAGTYENWIITPAVLSSAAMPVAMKDVLKADYSWSKGQGPASIYKRLVPVTS